ncbi:MAG: hypothetical protein HYZ54_00070 [Ignavibacteriae bacterium]|nr:hypothetical protein [Ignavibacteriota bacterium]
MSNTATNIPAVYPGGSPGQIQYNNSGSFGSVSGTTSDGTNITGMSIKSSFDLKGSASGAITINGGSAITNHSLILPSTIGTAGQVLGISNAGTGQLQWVDSQSPGLTGSLHTSSPNNTVNASRIIASGGTTNQDLVLSPKGVGAFQLQLPDGNYTGGNKRGVYAIDLQLQRSQSNQVASGGASFVVGHSNTSSNSYSIAMGYGNISSAVNSISIGELNTASASDSIAMGYKNNSNSSCSIALGCQSKTSLWGQLTLQGDNYNGAGKFQQFLINTSGVTSNSTSQELFLDGNSLRLIVSINTTYLFKILLLGHGTDNADVACYEFSGAISNRAGTTAIVGTVSKNIIVETDSTWDADVTADDTNDALVVTVTGASGKNIYWEAAHWVAQVSS